MVDGVIELNDELAGVRTVRRLQVKKSRGSAALGGYHQFEITSRGVEVFPRLELAFATPSVDDRPDAPRLASGVAGLDEFLGGGIPAGSVTLLFGPSGSGKTSLGLSFLKAATDGEPALHFGFYETPDRIRLKARALGVDLDELVENGALQIIWNPMVENLLDKLGHRLLAEVKRIGAKRLFLDGLGGFERAAISPARMVEFFTALTNELRAQGVTTIATWELRDLFGPTVTAPGSEISSLLDNLVMLRQVEIDSQYKRTISVLKVRDSAFEPVIHEVFIGNKGLGVGLPLQPMTGASTGLGVSSDRPA
jgi:circadian clock protein KaiC